MSWEALSIEGENEASAIRDAVLGTIPEKLRGKREGFDIAYSVGQEARLSAMTPMEAAEIAKQKFQERTIECVRNTDVVESLVPLTTW